jgi:hypothetical protein
VRVLPRGPIWNVNRSSEPGLGANECVPSGKWCESTAFRHSCARSSKRAGGYAELGVTAFTRHNGGFIPRIALDQCRDPERYRTRVPIFVPIAQNTERECPKLQVAGEIPAGDANLRVWFNSRMRPCQGRDDGATPFTRSITGGVAHQQSARLTCERQRGQHSSLPPFSRGHSSASQSGCFTAEFSLLCFGAVLFDITLDKSFYGKMCFIGLAVSDKL